jgi:hypothetical protein
MMTMVVICQNHPEDRLSEVPAIAKSTALTFLNATKKQLQTGINAKGPNTRCTDGKKSLMYHLPNPSIGIDFEWEILACLG